MAVTLNHTIVAARDAKASATFLSRMLGLTPPVQLGHFAAVRVSETSLDFAKAEDEIHPQHYAFLVSAAEFDAIFARIREHGTGRIHFAKGGTRSILGTTAAGSTSTTLTGTYWRSSRGRYGSGSTAASKPHPLIAPTIGPDDDGG
jgi:catechol 2,3-dioxygenase-like lactoylglutathione lyase family enzyme